MRCCHSLLDFKKILQVLFLCLHTWRFSSSTETAVIGVLNELTSPTNCAVIDPTSVYEFESLQWMVNILNHNNYTQNVKLEIDVADVCERKSSVIRTMELLKKYQTGPKKLIGILSMTTSANMLNVSWFLSSLPPRKSVIQIGTSETAYKLNDRTLYRTFFRVIPDDGYQFQLIAQLLKKLNWNYIAILYEKDVYGEEGAKLLSDNLPDLGITLAVKLGIEEINEQLFILTADYPNVKGVVIIAQPWTLQGVRKSRLSSFKFILTESVLSDDSFANINIFENSLAVMRPHIPFPSLDRYWENLFNANWTSQNEIFQGMVKHFGCPHALQATCNLTEVAEKLSKMLDKNSVLPKLTGLYIFAFLLRKQKTQCQQEPCPLSIITPSDIQKQVIDFSYLSQILHYSPMNLTGQFNEKGNLVYPSGFIAYKVYNNMQNDGSGRFKFQEVGYYNGKDLILNNSVLHNLQMWGICPKNKTCRICSTGFPKFLYKEGDIMLFGIVPVRTGSDAMNCPCYYRLSPSELKGSHLAEAMLYAVEQLNKRKVYKNLFPGKTIGIIIMDSCNQQLPTFKSMLSFLRATADICQKISDCLSIKDKIVVYIGGLSSEVSIRISQLMTAMKTIQISYASTSSIFRDPLSDEYANFLRLTPSDNLQISAIIDICVKMSWRYVSLIYANNIYGRSAQRELISRANHSNICVTLSLLYKSGEDPKNLLEELKRRPEAKIVIVFLNSDRLENFMTSITENIEEGEFFFLGSESWGSSLRLDRIGEKIAGSLSLGIDMPPDRAFEEYLKHKKLDITSSNEWNLAAMESQCYMPLSLNKQSSKACPANITLRDLGKQHLWATLVIQSVYAAAVGLNMSIAKICNSVEVCPRLFQKTSEIIEIFKQVKLRNSNGEYRRVFDNEGDGVLPYSIYKIHQKGRNFVYTKIGKWSQTSGLILDTGEINVPPLKCPNQKRCFECTMAGNSQSTRKNYIPPLIGFVFLLIILLVLIIVIWKTSRNTASRNENGTNELGTVAGRTTNDVNNPVYSTQTSENATGYNFSSHNDLLDDNDSIEDNRSNSYISMHDPNSILDEPDIDETNPKEIDECDPNTYPKVLWTAGYNNYEYEGDEDNI